MGGCATKPKVLTGDGEAEALPPAAAPETAKEEITTAPAEPGKVEEAAADLKTETKEKGVDVVEEEKKVVEGDGVKEIVGEQEDKPRSLSNLFKENEGKQGEAEAEPVKQGVSEAEKPKEESETKQPEALPEKQEPSEPEKPKEEPEIKVVLEAPVEVEEQTTIPAAVVDVPAKTEAEKVVDVTPLAAVVDVPAKAEAEKVVDVTPLAVVVDVPTKAEAEKVVDVTPLAAVVDVPAKAEAENVVDVTPTTAATADTQKAQTTEEKKTEEST
ncbi:altered inheritance of mitochondria protein 21-like isoform X2 [Tripterygium wilfordii]|uniref:Altered inheritance of mitochondria protein 21-like isoform X2 n=1 Tax=Tripterygium wilfordii TaxID=458696 RepID=A0A7J7C0K2_TRIWF|nr:fibrous sheath CABYR-binding protein-like [Tripterygium wilfordii]KAF5727689.1 altered inheritance of mitochondria protein 21-like isoform X2 [Tripterygium wilfordii]